MLKSPNDTHVLLPYIVTRIKCNNFHQMTKLMNIIIAITKTTWDLEETVGRFMSIVTMPHMTDLNQIYM